jgi:hypothetical protein
MVVVLARFKEAELKTDLVRVLLVDEIEWPFPATEDGDELDVRNTEIASRIASPATNCGVDDGS